MRKRDAIQEGLRKGTVLVTVNLAKPHGVRQEVDDVGNGTIRIQIEPGVRIHIDDTCIDVGWGWFSMDSIFCVDTPDRKYHWPQCAPGRPKVEYAKVTSMEDYRKRKKACEKPS